MPAVTSSPLALTVLGLLAERPMHPYEMTQLARTRRGTLVKVSPGTLYHSVGRLEGDGFVRAVGTDRSGNRPERTVYEITDAGRTAFLERVAAILETPADEFPQFPLGLAEAHNLPKDEAAALVRRRIAALEATLAELDVAAAGAVRAGVPELFRLGSEHRRVVLAAEARWLHTLAGRIESGDLPWLDSPAVQDAIGGGADDPTAPAENASAPTENASAPTENASALTENEAEDPA
ncbi:PadR family transcriptional regulator [Rhodococcus rhodnii]|uniref:Transcriptional regulator n=2 Tax=Rhodococcus rhodnii TaxID=38312 RepID=R7WPW9_9NOCA|nr:PadR family transcriptional regulator [Rhodococcus rhodnii]EOM77362.1 transcriptional regulator [Rhodococcus rhodnii LMG 5362]TXG91731.1 PadR family transcriptional regulator [Rhodococcus rhodnii]